MCVAKAANVRILTFMSCGTDSFDEVPEEISKAFCAVGIAAPLIAESDREPQAGDDSRLKLFQL